MGLIGLYAAFAIGIALAQPFPAYGTEHEFSDAVSWLLLAGNVVVAALIVGPRWAFALAAVFAILLPVAKVIDLCQVVGFLQGFKCTPSVTANAFSSFMPIATFSLLTPVAIRRLPLLMRKWPKRLDRVLLAGGGLALAGSLFLPWYSGTGDTGPYSGSGWDVFDHFQVFLVVVAAAAIVCAQATHWIDTRTAVVMQFGATLLSATAAGLIFYRLFTPADRDFALHHPAAGVFAALAACLVIAATSQTHQRAS